MQLFTLGYQGLSAPDFFAILKSHDVEVLVDVRAVALSRKPGFSKSALAAQCNLNGLEYQHWLELGCPANIRDAYRKSADWTEYTRCFKRHLPSKDDVLEKLTALADQKICALVCFEADPRFCHRYFVAQRIQSHFVSEMEIIHLTRNSVRAARSLLIAVDK